MKLSFNVNVLEARCGDVTALGGGAVAAWSTERAPGQPRLHGETLARKPKSSTKLLSRVICFYGVLFFLIVKYSLTAEYTSTVRVSEPQSFWSLSSACYL